MLSSVFTTGRKPIGLARYLRKNLTSGEKMLWKRLRAKRFYGVKFRRQAPLGPYIADFLCVGKRLIVEVDGPSHTYSRAIRHDQKRDEYFQSHGFMVIRFKNSHVVNNLDDVLMRITTFLRIP